MQFLLFFLYFLLVAVGFFSHRSVTASEANNAAPTSKCGLAVASLKSHSPLLAALAEGYHFFSNDTLAERLEKRVADVLREDRLVSVFWSSPELVHAVKFFLIGADDQAKSHLNKFFNNPIISKTEPSSERQRIADRILKLTKDAELGSLFAHVAVGFPYHSKNSIEIMMTKNLFDSIESASQPGSSPRPLFACRPAQIEAARIILRFGQLKLGAKILEIGYGNPSILKAFDFIKPQARVGVDLIEPPQDNLIAKFNLFTGNLPTDFSLNQKVSSLGPYDVIYGVDVFKNHVGFGEQFKPGLDNIAYTKWIASQLKEGGAWIVVVSSSGDSFNFSKKDILESGLNIERWNMSVKYPEQIVTIKPDDSGIKYYVLRRGPRILLNP